MEPRSVGARRFGASSVLALGMVFGLAIGVARAGPPDFCSKLSSSYRERDCCAVSSKTCDNLKASISRRGCTEDPCLIGCGMNLCDASVDEYCCDPTCSRCAPVGVLCPAEVCP